MLKKNLVILFVCVALDFVMVMVGWTAETISSEKLICKVDFSSGIAESLTVSPDNMHVAYGARKGNKWFVVVDGQEGKQYDGIVKGSIIKFNPDGSIYYLAIKGNGTSKATPNVGKSEETK
jgi:hypothetical protein